jgi:ubiquinone biosynthesis protein UbiJ
MKIDIAVPISRIARLLNKVVKKSETPRPTLKHLIGKEVLVKVRHFRREIFVEEVIK